MKINYKKLGLDGSALIYFESKSSFEEAWNECPRGEWMLEIAKKIEVDEKQLLLTIGHCANTIHEHITDHRCIESIDGAIEYGYGLIDYQELLLRRKQAINAFKNARRNISGLQSRIDYAAAYVAKSVTYVDKYEEVIYYVATVRCLYIQSINNVSLNSIRESYDLIAGICHTNLTESVFNKIKEFEIK